MTVNIDPEVLAGEEATILAALSGILGATGAELLLACMATAQPPVAFVGGWLRDLLLGRPSSDVDLVAADPDTLARLLCEGGAHKSVLLDPQRRTWRVVFSRSAYVDISALKGEGTVPLVADLRRRDLRVNAIAWTREQGLLDPLDGIADLRAGVLRTASVTALQDDPLRALRAWRLALKLNMRASDELLAQMDGLSLDDTAAERIRTEMQQILLDEKAPLALEALDEAGILFQVLSATPRLDLLRRCMAREWAGTALRRCRTAVTSSGNDCITAVRLGWLFEHPGLEEILTARRWPRRIARIAAIVSSEVMRLPGSRCSSRDIAADLLRWKDQHGPALLGRTARLPEPEANDLAARYLDSLEGCAGSHRTALPDQLPGLPQPILSAKYLCELAGIEPGPELGTLMESLLLLQLSGEIADEQQARRWLLATR